MSDMLLRALAERLTRRKRLVEGAQRAVDGLLIAAAAGLLVAFVDLFAGIGLPAIPTIGGILVLGTALGFVWGSRRTGNPYRALLEADHAYRTHEQLATAFELAERTESSAVAAAIVLRLRDVLARIDPKRLYRPVLHSRYILLPALLLATAVVSGLERSPTAGGSSIVHLGGEQAPQTEGPMATRPEPEPQLQGGAELADEIQNLGEARDEADQRGAERGEEPERAQSIEEQVRELEREAFEDDDITLGENAEEAVRGALRRGMSEEEILDVITRMRQEGESTADVTEELQEGDDPLPPNANTEGEPSEDAERAVPDELMPVPPSEDETTENAEEGISDTGNPTEGGEAQVTPGEDAQTGEAQASSDQPVPGEQPAPPETEGEQQARGESPTDRGGRTPAPDSENGDFSPTNESRVAAEITGTIVEETFLNLVIRDLPQEAVSELDEVDPEVRYERAVEHAIEQEQIPTDLEPLVRSYFLRIARRKESEND